VQLGQFRRDQFLVDRETGRVWSNVCLSKAQTPSPNCDGLMIWEEMYVSGVTPPDSPATTAFQAQLQSSK
jgi:hypothetical protein